MFHHSSIASGAQALPSLRAVDSTSRKPAWKPYGLEAGSEGTWGKAPNLRTGGKVKESLAILKLSYHFYKAFYRLFLYMAFYFKFYTDTIRGNTNNFSCYLKRFLVVP